VARSKRREHMSLSVALCQHRFCEPSRYVFNALPIGFEIFDVSGDDEPLLATLRILDRCDEHPRRVDYLQCVCDGGSAACQIGQNGGRMNVSIPTRTAAGTAIRARFCQDLLSKRSTGP
jgi:hypothetical protein